MPIKKRNSSAKADVNFFALGPAAQNVTPQLSQRDNSKTGCIPPLAVYSTNEPFNFPSSVTSPHQRFCDPATFGTSSCNNNKYPQKNHGASRRPKLRDQLGAPLGHHEPFGGVGLRSFVLEGRASPLDVARSAFSQRARKYKL